LKDERNQTIDASDENGIYSGYCGYIIENEELRKELIRFNERFSVIEAPSGKYTKYTQRGPTKFRNESWYEMWGNFSFSKTRLHGKKQYYGNGEYYLGNIFSS
jgi:predicted transcriptional regulator YdeE